MGKMSTSVGHHPYISQTDIDEFRSDLTQRPVLIPTWRNLNKSERKKGRRFKIIRISL